jgi:hypothetical protein
VAKTPSIDRRKHPHVLPRVEYGAQGKYVVICPQQGLLEFSPDSPEWFTWLFLLFVLSDNMAILRLTEMLNTFLAGLGVPLARSACTLTIFVSARLRI